MNLKQSMGSRLKGHAEETELNLTAVMNIFLILIPFMLLTAVFVRIAVMELSLPSLDKPGQTATAEKPKSTVLNILKISETGFELNSPDLKLDKLEKSNNDFNWQGLTTQLNTIKEKYPDSEDILISPEDAILYHIIIQVMDRCRESGFPNISISG